MPISEYIGALNFESGTMRTNGNGQNAKRQSPVQLKGYRRRALLKDIGTHTKKEWLDIVKNTKPMCDMQKKES